MHTSHHIVQLVQRDGYICVVCQKCTCCSAERIAKECRPPNVTAQALFGSHISGVRVSTPPNRDTLYTGM